jgi:nicotinamidase-related amidase
VEVKIDSLVEPATTVILTQECQRGIIGDLASPMMREACERVGMVDNIGRLVTAGRAAGCSIIHCVAELRPDHPAMASNAPILRRMKRNTVKIEWDPAVMEVVAGIGAAASDLVSVRSASISPVVGTEVPILLRNLKAKTVIAVGVSSNLGIPNLTFDCVNLGFNVVIPSDCIAGFPDDYTDVMLKNTLSMLADITTTDELIAAWSNL